MQDCWLCLHMAAADSRQCRNGSSGSGGQGLGGGHAGNRPPSPTKAASPVPRVASRRRTNARPPAARPPSLPTKPPAHQDPIGLVENVDQERFDRLRSVELKHGRVSMLAVLGHIVTSNGIRLPVLDLDSSLGRAPPPPVDRRFRCRASLAACVAVRGWLRLISTLSDLTILSTILPPHTPRLRA